MSLQINVKLPMLNAGASFAVQAQAAAAAATVRGNAGGGSSVTASGPAAPQAAVTSQPSPELDPPVGDEGQWELALQSTMTRFGAAVARNSSTQVQLAQKQQEALTEQRIEQQRKAWRSADKAKRKLFGIRISKWINVGMSVASFAASAPGIASKMFGSKCGMALGGFMIAKGIGMAFNLVGSISKEAGGPGFSFESVCCDVMGDEAGTIYAGLFTADLALVAKGIAMAGNTKDGGKLDIVGGVFKALEMVLMVALAAQGNPTAMAGKAKLLLAIVGVGGAAAGITQGVDTMELAKINETTSNAQSKSSDATRKGEVQTDQVASDIEYVAGLQQIMSQLASRTAEILNSIGASKEAALRELRVNA